MQWRFLAVSVCQACTVGPQLAFLALAPVPHECPPTVRAVGCVIAALAIVDQGTYIEQMVAVLFDGAGNQLARLSCCERWAFF